MKKHLILSLCAGMLLLSCKGPAEQREEATGVQQVNRPISGATMYLASWEEGPRKRVLEWLDAVTDSSSADFIPVADRIAVFDNDGTLWPEQPIPNQLQYCLDFLKAKWDEHPEWAKSNELKAAAEGDFATLVKNGVPGLLEIINATQNNQTEEEFAGNVRAWLDTAKNERFGRLYEDLVYQPMLELLDVLEKYEFANFIVSGGGADFMRVWTEEKYGIPPYRVIGSYGEVKYEMINGMPTITKKPGAIYVDDKEGKPQAIHRFIGKKPVLCGGNSDGDLAMMQYTSSSPYKSLCVLLHHTDAEREFAYDKDTQSGHLEEALTVAADKGWLVVDMKNDFKKIFPHE